MSSIPPSLPSKADLAELLGVEDKAISSIKQGSESISFKVTFPGATRALKITIREEDVVLGMKDADRLDNEPVKEWAKGLSTLLKQMNQDQNEHIHRVSYNSTNQSLTVNGETFEFSDDIHKKDFSDLKNQFIAFKTERKNTHEARHHLQFQLKQSVEAHQRLSKEYSGWFKEPTDDQLEQLHHLEAETTNLKRDIEDLSRELRVLDGQVSFSKNKLSFMMVAHEVAKTFNRIGFEVETEETDIERVNLDEEENDPLTSSTSTASASPSAPTSTSPLPPTSTSPSAATSTSSLPPSSSTSTVSTSPTPPTSTSSAPPSTSTSSVPPTAARPPAATVAYSIIKRAQDIAELKDKIEKSMNSTPSGYRDQELLDLRTRLAILETEAQKIRIAQGGHDLGDEIVE